MRERLRAARFSRYSTIPLKFSKSFFSRLFWFLVGGILSIWVNAGLFRLFSHGFGWKDSIAYGLSLAIINVLLFLWNYVVGFKSERHWTDAAWRQAVCLGVSNSLNYALVLGLLRLIPHCPEVVVGAFAWSPVIHQKVVGFWKEGIIAAVQVFIAFFKFGLYHYWVYPQRDPTPAPAEVGQVS
jgi:putative flippase GtrA